jgi:hypothetical protein
MDRLSRIRGRRAGRRCGTDGTMGRHLFARCEAIRDEKRPKRNPPTSVAIGWVRFSIMSLLSLSAPTRRVPFVGVARLGIWLARFNKPTHFWRLGALALVPKIIVANSSYDRDHKTENRGLGQVTVYSGGLRSASSRWVAFPRGNAMGSCGFWSYAWVCSSVGVSSWSVALRSCPYGWRELGIKDLHLSLEFQAC